MSDFGVSTLAKFYVYLSDTKVDMLHSQIPRLVLSKIAATLNINLAVFELPLSKNPTSETRYSKLEAVVDYIEKNLPVGSVDNPKEYFAGKLPMQWGRRGTTQEEQRVVHFGGSTGQTILGLGGSSGHILGASGTSEVRISPSYDTASLLNILGKEAFGSSATTKDGSLEMVRAATRSLTGPTQQMEFLAKRLLSGQVKDLGDAALKPVSVLLGTPIYVALVGS